MRKKRGQQKVRGESGVRTKKEARAITFLAIVEHLLPISLSLSSRSIQSIRHRACKKEWGGISLWLTRTSRVWGERESVSDLPLLVLILTRIWRCRVGRDDAARKKTVSPSNLSNYWFVSFPRGTVHAKTRTGTAAKKVALEITVLDGRADVRGGEYSQRASSLSLLSITVICFEFFMRLLKWMQKVYSAQLHGWRFKYPLKKGFRRNQNVKLLRVFMVS